MHGASKKKLDPEFDVSTVEDCSTLLQGVGKPWDVLEGEPWAVLEGEPQAVLEDEPQAVQEDECLVDKPWAVLEDECLGGKPWVVLEGKPWAVLEVAILLLLQCIKVRSRVTMDVQACDYSGTSL